MTHINFERIREIKKQWSLKNKEKIKEDKRKWYLKNKEKIKEYKLKNKEKIKEDKKEWYLKNREKIKITIDKYLKKCPTNRMLTSAKNRAKKKNIPFNIDKEYLNSIYPKDNKCPVLDVPFQLGNLSEIKKTKDYAPSLDRIIPEKGYIKNNLVIVSSISNRVKNNVSIETLEKILNFYKKLNELNK
jgi:hypothetical protein